MSASVSPSCPTDVRTIVQPAHLARGKSSEVGSSLRPVWAVTGNNVQLKGDLGRRVAPIDVDPKLEHPEGRTFKRFDLLGYVQENRPGWPPPR